jgi:hypothetical protein
VDDWGGLVKEKAVSCGLLMDNRSISVGLEGKKQNTCDRKRNGFCGGALFFSFPSFRLVVFHLSNVDEALFCLVGFFIPFSNKR